MADYKVHLRIEPSTQMNTAFPGRGYMLVAIWTDNQIQSVHAKLCCSFVGLNNDSKLESCALTLYGTTLFFRELGDP